MIHCVVGNWSITGQHSGYRCGDMLFGFRSEDVSSQRLGDLKFLYPLAGTLIAYTGHFWRQIRDFVAQFPAPSVVLDISHFDISWQLPVEVNNKCILCSIWLSLCSHSYTWLLWIQLGYWHLKMSNFFTYSLQLVTTYKCNFYKCNVTYDIFNITFILHALHVKYVHGRTTGNRIIQLKQTWTDRGRP